VEGGFIFRELHNSPQTINLALPGSAFTVPTTINVPATWDAQGNVLTTRPVQFMDIPKGFNPPSQNQISSPAGNTQIFRNLEFTVNKRMSSKFMVVGSFYWTHTTSSIVTLSSAGAVTNGVATNPNQLINNGQSYNQWVSHIDGSYDGPWGIRISPVLRMQKGAPLTPTYAVTGLNQGTLYLPLAPTGSYYNPNLYVMDLRFEKNFKFKERYRLSPFVDLFNLFNSNTANVESAVVSKRTTTIAIPGNPANGQTVSYEGFGSPTTILPPRILRLGVRFSF